MAALVETPPRLLYTVGIPPVAAGTGTITLNTIRIMPIYVPGPTVHLSIVRFEITTALAAQGCSFGLYDEDGNLVIVSDVIGTGSIGVKTPTLLTQGALQAGNYYIASTCTHGTPAFRGLTPANVLHGKGAAAESSAAGVLPATIVPANITDNGAFQPYVNFY